MNIEHIRALYSQCSGDTRRIAQELNIARSTVYRYLRIAGVKPVRTSRYPIDAIIDALNKHGNYKDAAAALNTTVNVLNQYIIKYKLKKQVTYTKENP